MAPRRPTAVGRVILDRLEQLSLSLAEVERRSRLSKNTIANAVYGPRSPQRKTIEILAHVLELRIEALTRPRSHARGEGESASFGVWLLRAANASLWIALAGSAATGFFLWRSLHETEISSAAPVVHFLVILVLLARLPRHQIDPLLWQEAEPRLRVTLTAAGDFRRYWGGVWTFWLLLYLGLAAASTLGLMATEAAVLEAAARWMAVVLNLLQNGATVMLLLAYEVVARPTVADDLSRRQLLPFEAWLAFAALPSLLEGAGVIVGFSWDFQLWFGWLSGFAQGTALALLVGRLDSKYIEPPTIVVALLYLYAAIQGAWPVFQAHYELMLILTFLALVLKCLLFLFIAWLFESRVLRFYLSSLRDLDAGVREARNEFLKRVG